MKLTCIDLKFVQSQTPFENILQLWRDPNRRSAEVHQLVTHRQQQVEQQIADLKSMHGLLSDLLTHCAADDSPECAIIDSLSEKNP